MRRLTSIFFALAALAFLSPAQAQDFPTRPVRLVVAFPPGGPTDFVARVIAEKLKTILGQPVVIENKPGANGAVGAEYVANAEPDGHTLFFTTVGAVAVTPHLRTTKSGYDPITSFAPVTLAVRNTTVLVVKPDNPAKSAKELADLARAKPDTIPFGSTGVGSMPHLALVQYQTAAKVRFLHVPYRGAAPALTDLLGGQVEALFADVPVLLPHIQGGKIRPLAVAADKRNAVIPDVPTLAELGLPNTAADNWYGVLAPAKTPRPIVMKLNAAFAEAMKDPETNDKLVKSGAIPSPTTPEAFGTYIKSELDHWGEIVKANKITEQP
ncbi:MAG: tripartite tricarboxylate transporter substrate binding protein [Pseudolabrys sp.]|nr:tripartite tricarboxylate transporter substrate binding protein [Pseudolabrys sp.]